MALALSLLAAAAARADEVRRPGLPPDYPLEREEVDTHDFPWSALGRVNLSGRGYCTGTLVSERIVVTAAHCLWQHGARRWFEPRQVHFVAGYQRETYPAHSVASKLHVSPDFDPRLPPGDAAFEHDWAILELAQPIAGQGSVPWIELDPARWKALGGEGTAYQLAGYRADRRYVLTVDGGCHLLGFVRGGHLVENTCPTIFGDSGGPLLLERGGRHLLVAISVGLKLGGALAVNLPTSRFAAELRELGVPPAELSPISR